MVVVVMEHTYGDDDDVYTCVMVLLKKITMIITVMPNLIRMMKMLKMIMVFVNVMMMKGLMTMMKSMMMIISYGEGESEDKESFYVAGSRYSSEEEEEEKDEDLLDNREKSDTLSTFIHSSRCLLGLVGGTCDADTHYDKILTISWAE